MHCPADQTPGEQVDEDVEICDAFMRSQIGDVRQDLRVALPQVRFDPKNALLDRFFKFAVCRARNQKGAEGYGNHIDLSYRADIETH